MTDAAEELGACVDVWWEAINDFTALLEKVPDDAWDTPTDLAGWDVRAIAAHVAHLESLLAGAEHEEVDIGEAPHARGMMGRFTEQGVVARRDQTPDELINEIRTSAGARHTELLADPPTDPDAPAPGLFGAIGWSTRTLLRNRPLDVWMHEQDLRRALGMPGGIDTPAAAHVVDYLSESLGYVLVRRVKAAPGTTAVLEVEGHPPVAALVNADGRGELLDEVPTDPTVGLRTDRESFIMLAGGRRQPAAGRVELFGDEVLGQRLVQQLAVTP
ncbi:maleylpyruvate isomerase family mycothiol-dependent enzyme [Nocardioides piscis]|uniref:Maleylpyruvate isomerase family mycothiol-dependent enzyme n=1 Tax=Nocardioides piscis TaxID=2714938 RepID=A0A6G7YE86_9ACTN|nr:maleylpyruvate isomerase family mycothiol-dependent enzyme [Nocardioides piscis]QIK75080.1 maleylpyruvate isomerase family mycothiol-dependent enzyme [Nocardioides piscis]